MSRSYKKPYVGDKANKWVKRQASKSVRYYKGIIPDGKYFKKLYCSWNIKDYFCYWPECDKSYRK